MKVSVVIPAYNATKTIDLCLRSVLKQDFSNYEVIVVDDGSTDDTREKVKKYPVRLISKAHGGTPDTGDIWDVDVPGVSAILDQNE